MSRISIGGNHGRSVVGDSGSKLGLMGHERFQSGEDLEEVGTL